MRDGLSHGPATVPIARQHVNGDTSGTSSLIPIAVIGMGCRFAGSATTPDSFWQMLLRGQSGWSRGDLARFKMDAFYHPAKEIRGAFNARGLYLLKEDIAHFDNQFFNISSLEAKAIDPQQRLMLEVAYEAFENAGIPMSNLSGSETGVYCAVCNHDYEKILSRDPEVSPNHRYTGTGGALVSNRISYHFNLNGPSITLDTACSGSLVAVHEACKALRNGEISQALVGGTNLILDPEHLGVMSSLQFLSDHGRCYSFDSRADGLGRGEGVAAIILKPLRDALRDGDPIQSVIRSSAVNQDGQTSSVTVPSATAQVRVINKAYKDAGLDPRDTCYVEAHGTGTHVGDKIESTALAETFCHNRRYDSPLYVGSVKTNIGHTECVSGLAGLIKSALALQKGMIPANLNFSRPNEEIPLAKWQIIVPQKPLLWPQNHARRASINNFGYGGTNAHVILESIESYLSSNGPNANGAVDNGIVRNGKDHPATNSEPRRLYVFTHSNERGMSALATKFKSCLQTTTLEKDFDLENLAYTLSVRRSHHTYRAAISASTIVELADNLDQIVKGTIRPRKAVENPKICFVFTGQGAQWARMGQELLSTYPVFAESMANADEYFRKLGADWSLLTELSKTSDSRISEAIISQPCCTAVQIALVNLLRSWSIHPESVCGHSSGEIAAAYAAGYLSCSDSLKVAFFRGQSVRKLKEQYPNVKGGMLAVGLSADSASSYIAKTAASALFSDGKVVIACINSPQSVTISGDSLMLRLLQEQLERDGIFNRFLAVDVAYHSHHMLLVHDEYVDSIVGLEPNVSNGQVRMVSSVTGKLINGKSLNAQYWAQNMTSPVKFSEAFSDCIQPASQISQNTKLAVELILEVGPHGALAGPIKQTLKAATYNSSKLSYYSVLTREVNAVQCVINTAGELFTHGVDVRLDSINDPQNIADKIALTTLPTYNWQHTVSHWSESRQSRQYRLRKFPRHDLLGVPSNDSLAAEPTWRNYVSIAELPWLSGHVVDGQVIFPASGFICMALEALRQMTESKELMWKNITCQFRQIVIDRALLIPESDAVEILFTIRQYAHSTLETSTWREFRVYSISPNGESSEHCHGLVYLEHGGAADDAEKLREKVYHDETVRTKMSYELKNLGMPMEVSKFYDMLKNRGLSYTGPFASVAEIHAHPQSATCCVQIPETKSHMPAEFQQPHVIHPSTLDAIVQTSFPALLRSGQLASSVVVSGIDEMSISSDINSTPGAKLLTHSIVHSFGRLKKHVDITVGDVKLKDPVLISVKGLCLYSMTASLLDSVQSQKPHLCNKIEWDPDITCSRPEHIIEICQIGLPEDPQAQERSHIFNQFIYSTIQDVLSAVSPDDEALMAPHHQKLLAWMGNQIKNAPLNIHKPAEERVASFGIEGVMLTHVSHHLVDIVKGHVDPLSVLMKDDLLYKFYSMVNIERCHIQLMNYLRQLKFKNPRMRILEIGAGTGSTSIAALDALQSRSKARQGHNDGLEKYIFSDISSGFFEKAKEKLGHWNGLVDFKKLDAELPVNEQGFEEESFDLIIASNVLHATRRMSKTMQNVRSLLKPNGKLALVEITELHMLWHIIVGTLPGWWLGAEDGRIDSPLLRLSQWDKLLQETGFSGSELIMKDYESSQEHQVSLIISSATSKIEAIETPPVQIVGKQSEKYIMEGLSKRIKALECGRNVFLSDLNQIDASGTICVVLLELNTPFLACCDEKDFQRMQKMLLKAKGVLWVTAGAAIESKKPLMAMITGLGRTLRSEDHGSHIVTLDLEANPKDEFETIKHIHEVLGYAFKPIGADGNLQEYEYAVRNGQILIPRVVENQSLETYVKTSGDEKALFLGSLRQPLRSLGLEIQTPGMLETLYWSNSIDHNRLPTANEVRVEISHIALNFKDLMNAMGKLAGLSAMLIECSGTIVQVGANTTNEFRVGDRVCAIRPAGLATTSNIDYRHVQRIPNGMPPELAAALLISYATAFYSLKEVARIKKGESVLIHAAAGALGQASIALAQHFEAGEIFVTVGSPEKRQLIVEKFGIPKEKIFSSRTLAFARGIRRITNGRGVDVVLNSLGAEATRESQNCLAQFGRFVELGKKDLLSNARMETQYLERNASFAAVDLGLVAEHKPLLMQEILHTVLDLVTSKKVQAISPITVKPVSELENAFRQLQTGKHIGKIVLDINYETKVMIRPETPTPPKLKEDCSYLVIGGLGGIGKAVVKHLAKLGAKHIATLSRSAAAKDSKNAFIIEMLALGVDLTIHQGSVTEIKDITRIKQLAAVQGRPIRGIVQGAMVLQDSNFNNMTHSKWISSLQPKVTGTMNLQTVFGDTLEFFILLSSDCGIVGTYGQSNYSAASTFQDAFARHLAHNSHPVRTIDLGVVGSSGYTAENEAAAAHVMRYGVGYLAQDEFFVLLNHAITHPVPDNTAESQVLTALTVSNPASGTEEAVLQRSDPKFSHIWARNAVRSTAQTTTGEINISASLLAAKMPQEAIEVVQTALVDKLARLLGLMTVDINVEQSASSYGMDSLISVELRNWVGKQLESHVQTFELMSAVSIQALSRTMTERSRLVGAALFHAKERRTGL